MNPAARIRQKLRSAIRDPRSAIPLSFLALLIISWQRWTSTIADSGREMDLPGRLLQGEWLYIISTRHWRPTSMGYSFGSLARDSVCCKRAGCFVRYCWFGFVMQRRGVY
jgi:hypothetical protein